MEERKLLIIDGDFLLYTATAGNKVLDSEGVPIKEDNKFIYTDKTLEEVKQSCDWILNNIFKYCSSTKYIGFLGGCKSFRYDIYPEYKANRTKFEKPKFFSDCKEYLIEKWKFNLTTHGLEADDAVNICKNILERPSMNQCAGCMTNHPINDYGLHYYPNSTQGYMVCQSSRYQSYNVIIVSPDKDLMKCIEGTYFNPKSLEIVKTNIREAYVSFWTSMICGDTTDNIKGLEGCGVAFTKKLFKNVYIDGITSCLEEDLVHNAYCKKYGTDKGKELFNLNYKLLKILDSHEDFVLPEIQELEYEIEEELDGGEFNN